MRSRALYIMRLTVCLAGLLLFSNVSEAAGDGMRATHDALFESFLPINAEPVRRDVRLHQMFAGAREQMWTSAVRDPAFEQLLAPFADMQALRGACGVGTYLDKAARSAFADLTSVQRERVLDLLQSCSENTMRRVAMNVRNYYVVKAYGLLQEPLTGVRLDLYAPAQYVAKHRPKLPPTRLRYDPTRKKIALRDGLIDYLIVGSGPAGSVLAHELRRGGNRVLLVERGSFIVPGSMETRLIDDLIDTRVSADGSIRIRNGNAAGGGSQVNADLCFAPTLPSIQAKIASWRTAGRISSSDFTKEQLTAAYEWVKLVIGTRRVGEDEVNANNRVLWDGAKRAGLHPKLYDLNTYAPVSSPYPVTDKRSAETELLIKALQDAKNPLSFIPDADVRRVLFEERDARTTAIGIEVRIRPTIPDPGAIADPNDLRIPPGTTITIPARKIILSAGALGSPAILLRSGMRNDQIGRGVILHPSMPVLGKFDHLIDALKGTQASVFVDDALVTDGYALESMSAEPAYAALMSPGPPMHTFEVVKAFRKLAGFGVMLIDTSSSENRIKLDGDGEPLIEYTLSPEDKERFRRGLRKAIDAMFLAGAKEVYLPTTEDLLGDSRHDAPELRPVVLHDSRQAGILCDRIQFVPNQTIITSAHMQATDKMGSSPRDSVVSRSFQVWEADDLYVVDGSVFPTSSGANPMQTIYTFAKIFADGMHESDLHSSIEHR